MFKYILIALGFVFNLAYAQQEPDKTIEDNVVSRYYFNIVDVKGAELLIVNSEGVNSMAAIINGKKTYPITNIEEDPWYGESPLIHASKLVKLNNGSEVLVIVASLSNGRACEYNTRILVTFLNGFANGVHKTDYEPIDQCYFNDIYVEMQEYHKVLGDAVSVGFNRGKSMIQYDLLLDRFKE